MTVTAPENPGNAPSAYVAPRVWWYVAPPPGIAPGAEWEWHCWRTRSLRVERQARAEAAQDARPAPSGATAGWRRGREP